MKWNYNIFVGILYSYLRYTDRFLIGAWMSFMKNQEKKIGLHKRVHRRICVRDITFLAAHPPSYVMFCRFFVYSDSCINRNAGKLNVV